MRWRVWSLDVLGHGPDDCERTHELDCSTLDPEPAPAFTTGRAERTRESD